MYANLIENHPDGIGKHIEVCHNRTFTDAEVIESFSIGEMPFYISHSNERYAVILGSDLVLNKLVEGEVPTIHRASEIINELNYYVDKTLAFLNFEKSKTLIYPIGLASDQN